MSLDRLTQIRIRGLRAIADVTLDLRGLSVLIGDNGSGKSTILDAFELLRQVANPTIFVQDVIEQLHGGLVDLLRHGSPDVTIGVRVEGDGPRLEYSFSLALSGTAPTVVRESLDVYERPEAREPLHALQREGQHARIFDLRTRKLEPHDGLNPMALVVASFGLAAQPAFQRLLDALRRIDHHVAFETRPVWQQRELDVRIGPRWPSRLDPRKGDHVGRFGTNLANCYQHLQNLEAEVRQRVVDRLRLGLGDDVRDFRIPPAGPGSVELEIVFGALPDKPIPARALSEGQLAYLLFVALVELSPGRSLLALDEPELHLHPALLARVVWMLEEISKTTPVVVATHSDRLLDALEQPADTVVLCELDEHRAVRLRRPSSERLAQWLASYRGIGALRAAGYEPHVFDRDQPPPASGPEQRT